MLKRSSENYRNTGNETGNYTGEIILTISKLIFKDEGPYILRNQGNKVIRTNLVVNCQYGISDT